MILWSTYFKLIEYFINELRYTNSKWEYEWTSIDNDKTNKYLSIDKWYALVTVSISTSKWH